MNKHVSTSQENHIAINTEADQWCQGVVADLAAEQKKKKNMHKALKKKKKKPKQNIYWHKYS